MGMMKEFLNSLEEEIYLATITGGDPYQVLANKYHMTRKEVKSLAFPYFYGCSSDKLKEIMNEHT